MSIRDGDGRALSSEIVTGFLLISIVTAAGYMLYSVRRLLISFIMGFLIAYVLNPVVDWLEARGTRRILAILCVYAVLLVCAFGVILAFWPMILGQIQGLEAVSITDRITSVKEQLSEFDAALKRYLPGALGDWSLAEIATRKAGAIQDDLVRRAPSILLELLSWVPIVGLAPVIAFFILKSGRSVKRSLVELAPNRYFEPMLNLLYKIDCQVGGYIRGQLTEACIVAALAIIGLRIIGLDYCVVVGAAVGAANIIPYFGYVIGIGLSSAAAILQHGTLDAAFPPIVVFVVIQLIDNNVIAPVIIGRSVSLSPLTVMMAVLIGGQLFGLVGLLVAVPVTGIMKVVITMVHQEMRRYSVSHQ